MENVVEYFIQELQQAENCLVKLSAVTALHESFLTKPPSCKVTASISDLIRCLFDILTEEFGVSEFLERDRENCVSQYQNVNEKLKTSTTTTPQVATVRGLLKNMTLKCIYEFSQDESNAEELGVVLKKSIVSFLANICDLEKCRYHTDNFTFCRNFTKCVKKYVQLIDCEIKIKTLPESEENNPLCNVLVLKQYLELRKETETAKHIRQIIDTSQHELLGFSIVSHTSAHDDGYNCSKGSHSDLVDLLVSQQVAWKRGRQFRIEEKPPKEKDVKGATKKVKESESENNDTKPPGDEEIKNRDFSDCVVRHVLNGNLFWINVGRKSIDTVEQIHSALEQKFESANVGLEHCRYCKQNSIVAALVDSCDMHWSSGEHQHQQHHQQQQRRILIRGKILSVVSGMVTVFGLDVGAVCKVPLSSIFYLPADLSMSSIPQQATLAYLYDISPTPVEYSHVELSLAIMSFFCRFSDVTKSFVDQNRLLILPALISCGEPAVVIQAVRLSTVISRSIFIECCDGWCQILLAVLECLNKLIQNYITSEELLLERAEASHETDVLDDEAAAATGDVDNLSGSSSHCNLDNESGLRKSPDKKSSNSEGTPSRSPVKVKQKQEERDDKERNVAVPEMSSKSESDPGDAMDDRQLVRSYLKLLGNLLHKNQPMKEVFYHQSGLETVFLCQRVLANRLRINSSLRRVLYNFVNTYSQSWSSHKLKNEVLIIGDNDGGDGSSDNEFEDEVDFDSSDEEDVELEDSGPSGKSSPFSDGWEKESSFLVKGSVYPNTTNPRCEMLEGLDWTSNSLAAIVCGMLNSGQVGVICVGVGKSGEVQGETVTHHMRDELRLGMDDLMAVLVPNVMHFQIQVRFVPVVEKEEEGEHDLSLVQLHVIEIICNPMHGVIHTLKNGKAYYRTGSKTMLANEQTIRHLIVMDEELKFMDEVLDLQAKVRALSSEDTDLE